MGYENWHEGINTGHGHSAKGTDQNLGKKIKPESKEVKIRPKKKPKPPPPKRF